MNQRGLMFKKSIILTLAALSLVALPACKSSKKSDSNVQGDDNNGNGGQPVPGLDIKSITSNNFFARVGFDFSTAVEKKDKQTHLKRFSFFFSQQQLLKNEKQAKNSGSYCELYIETHPQMDGSQIELQQGAQLRLGSVTQFKNNNEVSFNLVLQQSFSEQFQLFCLNTWDANDVDDHIGHILLLTQDNKPFPQQPKVKKIGFFQDSFSLMFSKGSQFAVIQGMFFGKELSKSTEISRLAWRLCSKNGCINDWQYAINGSKVFHPGSVALTMEVSGKQEINHVIKSMKSLELQLSVDAEDQNGFPRVTHIVDVGAYCSTNPQNFVNSDFNTVGCAP